MKKPFWYIIGAISLTISLAGLALVFAMDGTPIIQNGVKVGTYVIKSEFKGAVGVGMVMSCLFIFIGWVVNTDKLEDDLSPRPSAVPYPDLYMPPPAQVPPDGSHCPRCGMAIEANYRVCPSCTMLLKKECPGCHELLPPSWNACPMCGHVFTAPGVT